MAARNPAKRSKNPPPPPAYKLLKAADENRKQITIRIDPDLR